MRTDELDFELPPELIAQHPPSVRGASRLLQYRRETRSIDHRQFGDLPSLLQSRDLLVFNDTRVLPARFMLRKTTGGQVEALYLREDRPGVWRVLLRNLGPYRKGLQLAVERDPRYAIRLLERLDGGEFLVAIEPAVPPVDLLERVGRMPLPPYIKRQRGTDDYDQSDRDRYQTVFAREAGSVAAPTASLHFTETLFKRLADRGIEHTFVTLHVGMGTFKPVAVDALEHHRMHSEWFTLSQSAVDAINKAKTEGRRVLAVGTTAARTLESQPAGPLSATSGETTIFIYPPYQWKHVDGLITNFHLPRSTLVALVAAMVGLDEQRRIYEEAIRERYRFFSYGDAMLIE